MLRVNVSFTGKSWSASMLDHESIYFKAFTDSLTNDVRKTVAFLNFFGN